jgi:hypothetical protein
MGTMGTTPSDLRKRRFRVVPLMGTMGTTPFDLRFRLNTRVVPGSGWPLVPLVPPRGDHPWPPWAVGRAVGRSPGFPRLLCPVTCGALFDLHHLVAAGRLLEQHAAGRLGQQEAGPRSRGGRVRAGSGWLGDGWAISPTRRFSRFGDGPAIVGGLCGCLVRVRGRVRVRRTAIGLRGGGWSRPAGRSRCPIGRWRDVCNRGRRARWFRRRARRRSSACSCRVSGPRAFCGARGSQGPFWAMGFGFG